MTKQETKKFKMHPALLFSVIQAQAGTHEKALLEAVMNAVDAGASACNVELSEKGFKISDDGKGFVDKKEIEDFFETFGTPHKEGDAVYGRFRMGRGQLFSFAKTTWRTSVFKMEVDIKEKGDDFLFQEDLPFVKGCQIEGVWYKPLGFDELYGVKKEFEKLIKYMQIPVLVNGKDVRVCAEKEKWDYEDTDFYIKINESGVLAVYNLGALVANYPAYRFGISGTVVTKSALKINFARNDVLVSECKIWKKLIIKAKELLGLAAEKKKTLTQAERQALLNMVLKKEKTFFDFFKKGLLEDVANKKISFHALFSAPKVCLSSGDFKQKKLEEKINDSKAALVLSSNTLYTLGVKDLQELNHLLNTLIEETNESTQEIFKTRRYSEYAPVQGGVRRKILQKLDIKPSEAFTKGLSSKNESILNKDLSKRDLILLDCIDTYLKTPLEKGIAAVQKKSYFDEKQRSRVLTIGKSETALAWTDGVSYVTLNRSFLKNPDPLEILNILLHEYCHQDCSAEGHDHDSEFYVKYHDLSVKLSSNFLYMIGTFSKKVNEKLLKEGFKPLSYNYYCKEMGVENDSGMEV